MIFMEKKIYKFNDGIIQDLAKTDNKLYALMKYIDVVEVNIETDGFKCIINSIIGQQISDKARATIWRRFLKYYDNDITPDNLLNTDENELRKLGISMRKINSIKELAKSINTNEINFTKLKDCDNKKIIKNLTKIKGIGKWTAEMYLIFSLGRENVLSTKDGTLKRGIKWMYELKELPTDEEIKVYFKKWLDKETVITFYLWEAVKMNLLKEKFNNIEKKVNSNNK